MAIPLSAQAPPLEAVRDFAEDVRRDLSLTPRQIQSKYLYNALGSALFEAICRLPWYRITRAEGRLLSRYAGEMVQSLEDPITIVELGSGSGEKLAMLAERLRTRRKRVLVHLVDISPAALELSERTLGAFEHVSVVGHRATYEEGLRHAAAQRPAAGTMLVLFLGSNIGNFDRPASDEFLREIRAALRPDDALLLGTDLVKPEEDLLLAYDDPLGVTAAFNKNLLARINTELLADFDLGAFAHRAVWNAKESRVEMHLESRRAQTVRIPRAEIEVRFAAGERIWTESSYKYSREQVAVMGDSAGFDLRQQWLEPDAPFALTLFAAR
ncbi:MAG TPA: L-histidine N(alpha)-methyltransferase [Thermoanaerobaculia bacterium]|jgi:dimethylhistidine N-methyltransferase|nr:L-histidine N(alpha)-methyltransferase [Thermoanaerobaculia bacterium]